MLPICKALLVSATLLACASSAHAVGAFGIELGADIGNYQHADEPVVIRHELELFELTPPKPDPRFDTYAVDTHKGRIIRIMASSADDNTPGAEATLDTLNALKEELLTRYGKPSLNREEIANAEDGLLAYLVDEGGLEVLEWNFAEHRGKGLGAVYVFLAGAEDVKGVQSSYCTFYLESPDYADLSEASRLMEEALEDKSSAEHITQAN